MGRKLTQMNWDDVKKEMSIAGSPEKMTELGKEIMKIVHEKVDSTNRAELTNAEFAIQRVLAEIRLTQKRYDRSH
ncbi:hypothetical protein LZZ85_11450 [Terrimonas sp. NA20]|uniref:Uncharacterized protein n=1 Tax=Terrimonas ginsenosidimutans TaxID=2908004 RepID=A0ABS9KRH0_9BACT|nr:hypothetical protein [Terrimonas ginsenosidimutans]MCG2614904.1 hypothetical protein [Terrimonas ginsenosidimutans]